MGRESGADGDPPRTVIPPADGRRTLHQQCHAARHPIAAQLLSLNGAYQRGNIRRRRVGAAGGGRMSQTTWSFAITLVSKPIP